MVSDRDNALIPLRREFGQAWHGFDRSQVLQYLDHLESHVRRLLADRDSSSAQSGTLGRELENARRELGQLRTRVEELKKPPERLEDLDERMQRTARLAHTRAEEITSRAQVAAEENWAATNAMSTKLRERYNTLLAEVDAQAEVVQQEHQAALEATRLEVQRLTVESARRREQLDTEAERKRRAVEREFEAKMSAERSALEKHIADQRTASKNQAERRLAEATAEAKRLVDEATAKAEQLVADATGEAQRRTTEATREVERLARIHEQARTRFHKAGDVLAGNEEALAPLEDEDAELRKLSGPIGDTQTKQHQSNGSASAPAKPLTPAGERRS
jgi:colicin import membrane protein